MSLVSKTKDEKVMVFIDVRNIIRSMKRECPGPFMVDFVELVKQLSGNRNLRGAYCFDGKGTKDNPTENIVFHKNLQKDGFRMIVRDSYDSDEREQKEVDVSMALEMYEQAVNNGFDTAIIVSGDRDFVPAVEKLQSLGKKVEVASFYSSRSSDLYRAADECYNLSKLPIIQACEPIEETIEEMQSDIPSSNDMIELTEAI